jgi:hypothetical protein
MAYTTTSSRSTDKLAVLLEGVNDRILVDETLKARVKAIRVDWKTLEDSSGDSVFVPELEIDFKD